jgi:hypothetical protein
MMTIESAIEKLGWMNLKSGSNNEMGAREEVGTTDSQQQHRLQAGQRLEREVALNFGGRLFVPKVNAC